MSYPARAEAVGKYDKIHQLHLCRRIKKNECHGYETKPPDGEAPTLESVEYHFIGITPWSNLTGTVVPVQVPSMGSIELFNHLLDLKPFGCIQTNNWC